MPSAYDDSPIQIADHLYWVGHFLEDDRFQCHAYLLVHGDQSVLFDPGSVLTFPHTLRKIEQIIPFTQIRWFVCHHQDPDITGAMPLVDQIVSRPDARLVTHWRTVVILRHLGLKMPFWEVSENGWSLDLGGRNLEFLFTPYLHFPGAIVTFDRQTGTLLSSDLFGGFTEGADLFAQDLGVYEGIRAFHEHYMPSHEVLLSGMLRLERLPLELIAPQHGKVLRKELIRPIIERLKELDCGLYLMSDHDTRVERLLRLSQTLREMLRALHLEREFRTIAGELLRLIQQVLPAETLEFLVREVSSEAEAPFRYLCLSPENRYRGAAALPEPEIVSVFALNGRALPEQPAGARVLVLPGRVAIPLYSSEGYQVEGVALVRVPSDFTLDGEVERVLAEISVPLGVALERDRLLRQLQLERDVIQAQASRDPLTDLYTRRHMNEVVGRLVALHDRDPRASFAIIVLDVDHFKRVNDTHGHVAGDAVLRGVADAVRAAIRTSDIAVRYGGEEFVVLADVPALEPAVVLAERIRRQIAEASLPVQKGSLSVTASAGVVLRAQKESFLSALARADEALYKAKQAGRNRVCTG